MSIIEDMTTEDKLENMKAIVNGTMRRKLYFNPAYFEPHLLMVTKSEQKIFKNRNKKAKFSFEFPVSTAGCDRISGEDS